MKKQPPLGSPLVAASVANKVLSKMPKSVVNTALILGGGVVAYFIYRSLKSVFAVQNSVLESLNLIDSKEDIAVQEFVTGATYRQAFNPQWHYSQSDNEKHASEMFLDDLATDLNDAFGFFNDDEEAIIGVFKNFESLADVSRFSSRYYSRFGSDLYATLADALSVNELNTLITFIKTLS